MKKTTNQMTQEYLAPDVKVYNVKPSVAMMSNINGVQSYSDDAEESDYGQF